MKRFIFILIIVFTFIFIGYSDIKSFNYNNVNDSIKALNSTVQACQVDMESNKDLICD